ncbi:hypothetical protein [Leucobacter sp. GX24907]
MTCPTNSISCRLDEIIEIMGSGASALDIWTFVIAAIGTAASTAIALVATVLTFRASKESRRQEKLIRTAEERRRRADIAHDMAMWFADGKVFMIADLPPTEEFATWADRGDSLLFRARSFEEPGAAALMLAAKEVRALVLKKESFDRRLEAAIHAAGIFKLCAERWVEDPSALGELRPEAWVHDSWFEEDGSGEEQ